MRGLVSIALAICCAPASPKSERCRGKAAELEEASARNALPSHQLIIGFEHDVVSTEDRAGAPPRAEKHESHTQRFN